MSIRGVISHRERSRQINDFQGLRFERNITPTDIDGLVDFAGRLFIYFELKYGDKQIDTGQRMALEAVVDSHQAACRHAYAIIATHNVANPADDVDVANCIVSAYYYCHRWIQPGEHITMRQAIDKIKQYTQSKSVADIMPPLMVSKDWLQWGMDTLQAYDATRNKYTKETA